MGICRNCNKDITMGKTIIFFLKFSHIKVCHDCYDNDTFIYIQQGFKQNWLKTIMNREIK